MAQNWTDDVYASSHVGATDLQNIENNFAAIKSFFSGASAPSNAVAGMPWFDTAKKVSKQRNAGNSAWLGLMHGDVNEKRLAYRDAAMDGYARDSGVTDKVIALKGGSTYTSGGATSGSWTITGLSSGNESAHTHAGPSHNHKWYVTTGSANDDQSYNSAGNAQDFASSTVTGIKMRVDTTSGGKITADQYTNKTGTGNTGGGTSHSHSVAHNGSSRIAAAVCILVYLDL